MRKIIDHVIAYAILANPIAWTYAGLFYLGLLIGIVIGFTR
jgi:hypothetical protein